jgi:hypothetical protein
MCVLSVGGRQCAGRSAHAATVGAVQHQPLHRLTSQPARGEATGEHNPRTRVAFADGL